jgi:hypothetical protein
MATKKVSCLIRDRKKSGSRAPGINISDPQPGGHKEMSSMLAD